MKLCLLLVDFFLLKLCLFLGTLLSFKTRWVCRCVGVGVWGCAGVCACVHCYLI